MAKASIVGDVINFRGLVYGPVNEMGVVALFSKVGEEIGFIIEEIRADFPDCIARRQVAKGWERVAIEFEFKSSNFFRHKHDAGACDLIVCWEHDWETCPVPVLALKPYIADAQANVQGPVDRVRIADPLEVRTATLTAGGIKNGYISILPLDGFWPAECIGGNRDAASRHLIVEFEGMGRITTDISGRYRTFRSSSRAVRQFICENGLVTGDELEIIRVGKYEYKVRVARRGRPECRRNGNP